METPRLLLERMQRRAKKEWLLVSYSWIWMLSLPSKLIGNAECTKQWQFYTCTLSIIREYFLLLFGAKNNFIWLVLVLLKMNKIVYFAFSLHYHLRIDILRRASYIYFCNINIFCHIWKSLQMFVSHYF